MSDLLKDLLCENVPVDFWSTLVRNQEAIYEEARERACTDVKWTAQESESVLPIIRRALFEHELRTAAQDAGLQAFNMQHAGRNYGYVLVRSGRFIITAHHVADPKTFVRPCVSREQNASVNMWLDTIMPEGFLDLPSLAESGSINAYVLHGLETEVRGDEKFENSFLQLAIPDAELSRYQRNYPMHELLGTYSIRKTPTSPVTLIPDRAMPSINKTKIEKQQQETVKKKS